MFPFRYNRKMANKKQPPIPKKNPELDSALRAVCVHDSPELIGALLDLGADLHCADANGFAPLHIAAGANKPRACAALLRRGADAKSKTAAGLSPLHVAAMMDGFFAVPELVDCGVDLPDESGSTASHLAAERDAVLSLSALRKCGADFLALDSLGRVALHRAGLSGSARAARELCADGGGAATSARDAAGQTALHCASGAGHSECAAVLCALGSEVSAADGEGDTALHLALRGGHSGAASVLSRFRADLFARNAAGESCLDLALSLGGVEALAAGEELRGAPDAEDAEEDDDEAFRLACEVLGCKEEDSFEEKKSAWRRACMRTHPDRKGGDGEAFKKVQAAWRMIQLREGG